MSSTDVISQGPASAWIAFDLATPSRSEAISAQPLSRRQTAKRLHPPAQAKPQSGYALQPRVAASATLGRKWFEPQPQRGCVGFDLRKN